MPYNPSTGIYSLPAIYLAIPGTVIIAAQHNTPLEDLSTANNYARPVIAGGTGANNTTAAATSLEVVSYGAAQALTAPQQTQARDNIAISSSFGFVAGQCHLSLSGGNLLLARFNGRYLIINGNAELIPSAGITLAPTGLTPSTLYYIYAYMNSGTMTLEASTTANATDSTTGMQIKTGDATRTLVGMARPITGPAFVDSNTQRLVLSYFNRLAKVGQSSFSAVRTTTSTSFVEINTEIRVEFLAWGDEALRFNTWGGFYNNTANASYTLIGIDGVSTKAASAVEATAASYEVPLNMSGSINPGVGYHYATIGGRVGGGTGLWDGIGDGACTLQAEIKG